MIRAAEKLFSLIKILSEKRKTIPENPSRTPNVFVKLIFSLLVKKWARTVALKGVLAINIAAKLLWTFWTPYAIKKKGRTKLIIPIIANQYQSFENASILIWATLFLIPITAYTEQPWNLNPSLESTISVIYLGIVATGFAWLLRFRILINNGLVFQAQVAYLIPIFGIILGYIFLNELITPKVVVAVVAVIVGIYFVKKSNKIKII